MAPPFPEGWRGLIVTLCALLAGCGNLGSWRLLAPADHGMEVIRPGLYVEPAMSAAERNDLMGQINHGHRLVTAFFGTIESSPAIVACVSTECAVRFGSGGGRAAAFGDSAIRLAPNGLTAAMVAHEWGHAELYRRVGGVWAIHRIPRWFDEGIAVVIADEARHSAENWAEIQRRGYPTPALSELVSYRDWIKALQHYGEMRGDHPENLRVIYSTAGNELRRWLACAGKAGLIELLTAIRNGEEFASAYAGLERRCANRAESGRTG